MDFKFIITCKSCGCNSELSPKSWIETGRYVCPNCRKEMPSSTYLLLKAVLNSAALLPNTTEGFSIAVSSCQSMTEN